MALWIPLAVALGLNASRPILSDRKLLQFSNVYVIASTLLITDAKQQTVKATKYISWFVPSDYHFAKTRLELRKALSFVMWIRIIAVVLVIVWALSRWLNRVIPDLDVDWPKMTFYAILGGVFTIVFGVLASFLPPYVSVNKRGISVQRGQHARGYPFQQISKIHFANKEKWTFLQFTYKEKEVEIALGRKISSQQLTEFLKTHQIGVEI